MSPTIAPASINGSQCRSKAVRLQLLAKQELEKRAKDGGWSSVEKMKEGEAAGFSDRNAYVAHLAEQAAERAAAALEKELIKSAREAGELAVEYRYCRYSTWGAAKSAYGANKTIMNASDPLFTNAETVLDEGFLRKDLSSAVQQAYLAPQEVWKRPSSQLELDLKTNSRFATSYYKDNCIAHVRRVCQAVELQRTLLGVDGVEKDKSFAESQVEFWCGRIQDAK
jgi:hypothetical protein